MARTNGCNSLWHLFVTTQTKCDILEVELTYLDAPSWGFFVEIMPCWTYQIAIRENDKWLREYVCAEDRVGAVMMFCEAYPQYPLEFLLQSDVFEVERCE